jgi:hypothetical protein
MAAPSWFFFALIPLVLWRLYARVRRHIGRQRSRAWRHWFGVVFFPLLAALLALAALGRPLAEAALAAGVVGGAVLAIVALRLAKFERTEEGFFYTPNAYIGVGITLLLIGRVLYRFTQIYGADAQALAASNAEFGRSPLTLALVGLLVGYYTVFAGGLLRWRKKIGDGVELQ